MSKKKINNRLKDLFSGLEQAEVPVSQVSSALSGWTWECDAFDLYTACSPEVEQSLGFKSEAFIGQSLRSFLLSDGSQSDLQNTFEKAIFPVDVILQMQSRWGVRQVRCTILNHAGNNGNCGFRGYAQILQAAPQTPAGFTPPDTDRLMPIETKQALPPGLANGYYGPQPSSQTWTLHAKQSLEQEKPVFAAGDKMDQAVMAVPFKLQDKTQGVIELIDQTANRRWTEDDRLLVIEVVQQLEQALENARLYRAAQDELTERVRAQVEAQRRAVELQTAAEIARDASSTLAQDMLLSRFVHLLSERFGLYHTAIYLLDDEDGFACIEEAAGQSSDEMKRARLKVLIDNFTCLGAAITSGEPVIINNSQQTVMLTNRRFLPDSLSELSIPLKIGDRLLGALDVHASQMNAFPEDAVAVFRTLSDQIAVAIDNARSYELAQKAVAEMREVDRLKSQFLANMSHELRTPLNSIIGFSKVILKGIDGPVSDLQKMDLTAIYNSGQHLLALITDILDLSKIEAGKMEMKFENVSLPDLINSVMPTAIGLVKDKPIKLNKIIQPDLPLVWGDSMRLRQVLINLFSNAAKFTEEGSITIEAKTEPGLESKPEVIVTVTDTGSGIAVEDQNRLFKAFSQVDDSPTRKTGGTGLGLSISRSFIELHDGRIGLLNSEIGKGSTFYFTLPVPQVEEDPANNPVEQSSSEQQKSIMVIEDDPQVISLYQRYLQNQGFKVIPVTDATKAVQQALDSTPDAITLDIMMPNMDGWQVLHALKSSPQTRDIPVIVCSILEEEKKGFNLGATDYLVKPILQDDLIKALDRLSQRGAIKSILVIDDDADEQRLLNKIIQGSDHYQVSEALRGEQAWEMMAQAVPDLVILDLFMPGMDGFTLLGKMQSSPTLKDVPVLVITGADLTEKQRSALTDYGQQALVKGSMSEQQLLDTIQSTLNRLQRIPATIQTK
jgi:signal transduction histidine kinase/DNA-binding response OmpR family regulator